MATGLSSYLANSFMDSLGNASSFAVSTVYIQLHTANPGSAGTSSIALETSRSTASFASSSSGQITSDADVSWVAITGSETVLFFTAWDASTSGNFLFSGSVTANPYTAGDTFTITSGSLTASLTLAS